MMSPPPPPFLPQEEEGTSSPTTCDSCCNCKSSKSKISSSSSSSSPSATITSKSNDEDHNDATIDNDTPWTYSGKYLQTINFPLGGFGTGQILLQGNGIVQGFMIQNNFHMNHDHTKPYQHPGNIFGIKACTIIRNKNENENSKPQFSESQSYMLQTPPPSSSAQTDTSSSSHIPPSTNLQQQQQYIPSLTMKCQYPIATIQYDMPSNFPIQVELECMTPMIPGNVKDSSLPIGIFTFSLYNTNKEHSMKVSVLQSTLNFIGWDGKSNIVVDNKDRMMTDNDEEDNTTSPTNYWEKNVNIPIIKENSYTGWSMISQNIDTMDVTRQGSLALVAIHNNEDPNNSKTGLLISDSHDEMDLWNNFKNDHILDPNHVKSTIPSMKGHSYIGGVTQTLLIPPETKQSCQFVLTWYFPNRPCYAKRSNLPYPMLGNYYQNWFLNNSATDVIDYYMLHSNNYHLVETTRSYVQTIYSTTIPYELLESAAGRVSILRSPSMFWTKDGIVLGNEGNECCPLNCTHVYGYSTLIERLYPELAKDMLYSNLIRNFDPKLGGCTMRFGNGISAIDGSLACIIKVYLVIQQSDPNLEFLKLLWSNIKCQIELIMNEYVTNTNDCIIRGFQQNTYDTSMQGENTFIGSYWVTALKTTCKMAYLMGDYVFSKLCQEYSIRAMKAYEEICWNETFQYYIANVNETNCTHSYGTGCFIDQLCAVSLSLAVGLGHVFHPDHEAQARRSIFNYNQVQKPPFQDFQKHFNNGDQGIRVNTYPHGKLPGCYVYDDLVSTGFSYPVIAAMLSDNDDTSRDMAVQWTKWIRNRHNGINRSPWNEPECGQLYVRAMAAWNLFDQACGFHYDCITASVKYSPKFNVNQFSCFLIVENGWGQFQQIWNTKVDDDEDHHHHVKDDQMEGQITIKCLYGSMELLNISTEQMKKLSKSSSLQVTLGREIISATSSTSEEGGVVVTLGRRVTIQTGSTLSLIWSSKQRYVSNVVIKPPTTTKYVLRGGKKNRSLMVLLLIMVMMILFLLGVWWLRSSNQ